MLQSNENCISEWFSTDFILIFFSRLEPTSVQDLWKKRVKGILFYRWARGEQSEQSDGNRLRNSALECRRDRIIARLHARGPHDVDLP